jgi:2-octaprenyl-6-methoxyphenol hydroxylase
VFGTAVMQQIRQLPGVDFYCPASVSDLTPGTQAVRIAFEQKGKQDSISAKLVVGADGAHSSIRQSLGIETETHDYGTTAIICNFMPAEPHRGRAFECFTPSGPLAVLPHLEGRCGLVWCVERDQVVRLTEMDASEFLLEAERGFVKAFGQVLGAFARPGSRTSYPLQLVRAEEDTGPRTVIMGNAAHAIHPIGAQGFNLGLRDVAVLAEVLLDARNSASDIGDDTVLARYSEWRKTDQSDTIAWSDGLARIFANPTGLAAFGRTAGMVAHSLFPPLRRRMAARAMGFRGRIPRLAQGQALRVNIK